MRNSQICGLLICSQTCPYRFHRSFSNFSHFIRYAFLRINMNSIPLIHRLCEKKICMDVSDILLGPSFLGTFHLFTLVGPTWRLDWRGNWKISPILTYVWWPEVHVIILTPWSMVNEFSPSKMSCTIDPTVVQSSGFVGVGWGLLPLLCGPLGWANSGPHACERELVKMGFGGFVAHS